MLKILRGFACLCIGVLNLRQMNIHRWFGNVRIKTHICETILMNVDKQVEILKYEICQLLAERGGWGHAAALHLSESRNVTSTSWTHFTQIWHLMAFYDRV